VDCFALHYSMARQLPLVRLVVQTSRAEAFRCCKAAHWISCGEVIKACLVLAASKCLEYFCCMPVMQAPGRVLSMTGAAVGEYEEKGGGQGEVDSHEDDLTGGIVTTGEGALSCGACYARHARAGRAIKRSVLQEYP
jgi:hypothetical protein